MDIYIARQPIFDKKMNVVAYELLYRSDGINVSLADGDCATSSVILNGPLMIGLETLTDKKKAFIKFTRNFLLHEITTILGPEAVTVEIVESVESDPFVVESLRQLKSAGYTIALDAYEEKETFGDVLTMVDIIKVDFKHSDQATISRIANCFSRTRVNLFAEKIETQEQYEIAANLGYTYFQGFFFEKPKILVSKDIQSFKVSHIKIMNEIYSPEPDFAKIAEAIENDLSLTYKLLKVVNTGAYYGTGTITSIRQALVRLGLKEVYKWMSLVIMRDAGHNKPEILARTSIIRARALESLAEKVKLGSRKTEYFLLGMLSLIDVIMERPMNTILKELPLDEEINAALAGEVNCLHKGLEIIRAYERADWDALEQLGGIGSGMTDAMLFESYFEAIRWTQELYG